ncbi:MAG TPA: NifB/NifX family molybdenum-iron cluster-binding protein [Candidatus Eremiobacteraeota bacterium]|nr:MAG: Dinitrogenase iron-molybdenum cofactor [bacterium ADurb.Bin363]HPZ08540.1 NifB/NifX family molybdenum-iron cluster-binding protein [Candidatus Eremiobacteraeota bacterium]
MEKIAFTSEGKQLSSKLHSEFSSTPYFIIVELLENKIEVLKNPGAEFKEQSPAVIEASKFIINQDVTFIVGKHFDIDAYNILFNAGVDLLGGIEETVEQNLEAFKKGILDIYIPYTEEEIKSEKMAYKQMHEAMAGNSWSRMPHWNAPCNPPPGGYWLIPQSPSWPNNPPWSYPSYGYQPQWKEEKYYGSQTPGQPDIYSIFMNEISLLKKEIKGLHQKLDKFEKKGHKK